MRPIKYIVIHCTATPQTPTVAGIQNYWRKQLGWKNPGYHFIVLPDGSYQDRRAARLDTARQCATPLLYAPCRPRQPHQRRMGYAPERFGVDTKKRSQRKKALNFFVAVNGDVDGGSMVGIIRFCIPVFIIFYQHPN